MASKTTAAKKSSAKKSAAKKSTTKKTNTSKSLAAKGYVKAPKEIKTEKEVKAEVKGLFVEEKEEKKVEKVEVKEVKKENVCNKIFKAIRTNIKNILVVLAIALALVLVILLIVNVCNKNNQKELEANFETIGKKFYEEYYYNGTGKDDEARAKFLAKFKDNGLRINLDNLSRYEFTDEKGNAYEFVNKKTKENCDATESVVVIYPQEPYGKTDYVIDAKLSCGFEK